MQLFTSDSAVCDFIATLGTRAMGKLIDYRARTGSTNDLALHAARNGAPHGALFIADAQDAGRGRRGRAWESPAGLGLLFSVLIRPAQIRAEDIGWVPLVAGLACVDGIASACGLAAQLKWPNDLIIPAASAPGWRKLGGILCESVLPPANSSAGGFVVIGIGINVNHTRENLPELAKAPPTSLLLEQNTRPLERLAVLREILRALEQRIDELSNSTAGAKLKSGLQARLRAWWPASRMLQVQLPEGEIVRGTFAGLDEFGRLKLSERNGKHIVFADAEILSVS